METPETLAILEIPAVPEGLELRNQGGTSRQPMNRRGAYRETVVLEEPAGMVATVVTVGLVAVEATEAVVQEELSSCWRVSSMQAVQ